MYIYLFDRPDRLGSQIVCYISQILFADKYNLIIKLKKDKEKYYGFSKFQFEHQRERDKYGCNISIFVKILFEYIDIHNRKLKERNIDDNIEYILNDKLIQDNYIKNQCIKCGKCFKKDHYFQAHLKVCKVYGVLGMDLLRLCSYVLRNIEQDIFSYFKSKIFKHIKVSFKNLTSEYKIPFDVNKTILVHLRLEDKSNSHDYHGKKRCEYYKKKIHNNEDCFTEYYHLDNTQSPLSKNKIDDVLNLAKKEFNDYKIILLTAPGSDTSEYSYDVIKNEDENLDLYLLTMCKVVVLSRSNFAVSSLFFSDKKKVYCPLWGYFTCYGLDTKYDKNNFFYFY